LSEAKKNVSDAQGYPGGGNGAAPAADDVKSLHAKIGELTLENDSVLSA
jgi:hypothetical protein